MAASSGLKFVNPLRFTKINEERKQRIAEAPASPLPEDFPVNLLAASLHPAVQHVVISGMHAWDANCKNITFAPDPERGTHSLACFQAGAYLSLEVPIDGRTFNRPYSISSSPKDALDGEYVVTIKRVPGGTVSNYMLDHAAVGDKLNVSGPLGEFNYVPVRDARIVIGIAGGSGITPFHFFAEAIAQGDEDFNLILLCGSRTENTFYLRTISPASNSSRKENSKSSTP